MKWLKSPKIWMDQKSKRNILKMYPGLTEIKLEVRPDGHGYLWLRARNATKASTWTTVSPI